MTPTLLTDFYMPEFNSCRKLRKAAKIGSSTCTYCWEINWRAVFKGCGSQMRPTGLWLTFNVLAVAETWHLWWYYSQRSHTGTERWLDEARKKKKEDTERLVVSGGNLAMVWIVLNVRQWAVKCNYSPWVIQDSNVISSYVFKMCMIVGPLSFGLLNFFLVCSRIFKCTASVEMFFLITTLNFSSCVCVCVGMMRGDSSDSGS